MTERPWFWSSKRGWFWGEPNGDAVGPFDTFIDAVASYRGVFTPRLATEAPLEEHADAG